MQKNPIKISSSRGNEFSSDIVIGGEKYLIETDSGTAKHPVITTRIYLKGTVLDTIRTNVTDVLKEADSATKIGAMMKKQHQSCIERMQMEKRRREKSLTEYASEVKNLIGQKKYQEASRTLAEKLELHPDDPTLLSYAGLLEGLLNKRYRDGVATCKKAIDTLKKNMLFGAEFFYPELYINLGMTYLAGGSRKEALEAFHRALKVDRDNPQLKAIFKEIGIRRPPPISFLDRSHFLNKFIGKMTYKGLDKK